MCTQTTQQPLSVHRSLSPRVHPAATPSARVRGRAGVAEPHRAGSQHPMGSLHVCEEQHRRGDQTHHVKGLQEPAVRPAAVTGERLKPAGFY